MKNPLRKRLIRELRSDFVKYLVMFILMAFSIAEVSGFLVADHSMIIAYDESFEHYNIEDGHFLTDRALNKSQIKDIQENGAVTLYKNDYIDEPMTNGSTVRAYINRTEVDLPCVMDGRLAENEGEIAVDRMYADNNGLAVGDTITAVNGMNELSVVGLVALSDYSALFQDNNDSMFDASQFGVGIVTEETFAGLSSDNLVNCYSWKYDKHSSDEDEEVDMAEDLMKVISANAALKGFVPKVANKAIQFTGEDMGSDKTMMELLLYIIIVIIAFVFAVTISNTISQEANVIGTLRASGYTRRELLLHYMALPVIVTVISALTGNIFGYTVMKNVNAGLYYGSYSLPTYVTRWNMEAFLKTTLIPVAMVLVIDYTILRSKLALSPLKFLRRDLSRRKSRKALPLSRHLHIFFRYRLRVFFQNIPNYVILFLGILFANVLMLFGIAFPALLKDYEGIIQNSMIAKYQYVLSPPLSAANEENKLSGILDMFLYEMSVETENEDAEKFTLYTLKTMPSKNYMQEEISVYGVDRDSKYLDLELGNDGVYITSVMAEKYQLKEGDTVTLKECYDDKSYDLKVGGIFDYQASLAVFMDIKECNDMFDYDPEYFSGYFSDTEITDIDGERIGTVIDYDSLTKISRQLMISMGSIMDMVSIFAVFMSMILIYILSKIIIEKNIQSISMAKILGYRNGEISRLYLAPTTFMVVFSVFATLKLAEILLIGIFSEMEKTEMTGWIPLHVSTSCYIRVSSMILGTYLIVLLLEYIKIQRIRKDEALKNVE